MDLGIRGRKALVNGGSAGLGKGAAKALAAEGVELYISARGADRLEATAEEIRLATGAKVVTIAADHSSEAGRETILAACPEPDILVGTCSPAPFTPDFREVTVEQWQEHGDQHDHESCQQRDPQVELLRVAGHAAPSPRSFPRLPRNVPITQTANPAMTRKNA